MEKQSTPPQDEKPSGTNKPVNSSVDNGEKITEIRKKLDESIPHENAQDAERWRNEGWGTPKTLTAQDLTPVKVPPMHHPTEKEGGPPPTPIAPAKRIGYALVGLGKLTLEQLLPAFGACEYSKVVALVSGDAEKAANVARQYGISTSAIYNYKTLIT